MKKILLLVILLAPGWVLANQWKFNVYLDDTPIGRHDFLLSGEGSQRKMTIRADMTVKVLFINAYRYRHDNTEQWQGNCLTRLRATTNDNGDRLVVSGRGDPDRFTVTSPEGTRTINDCVMSYAYWNPVMLRQNRLLNPQTGRYEQVTVSRLGRSRIDVRGRAVPAEGFRLRTSDAVIDLWYDRQGQWLALETDVKGKRLKYRLRG